MSGYCHWFDQVDWKQHILHLQSGLETFRKKNSYYFLSFCVALMEMEVCVYQRISFDITDELGKLEPMKQDQEMKQSQSKVLWDEVGWVSPHVRTTQKNFLLGKATYLPSGCSMVSLVNLFLHHYCPLSLETQNDLTKHCSFSSKVFCPKL